MKDDAKDAISSASGNDMDRLIFTILLHRMDDIFECYVCKAIVTQNGIIPVVSAVMVCVNVLFDFIKDHDVIQFCLRSVLFSGIPNDELG